MNQLNVLCDVKLLWSALFEWKNDEDRQRGRERRKSRRAKRIVSPIKCVTVCAYFFAMCVCVWIDFAVASGLGFFCCCCFTIQCDSSRSLIYSRWTMRKYSHKQIASDKFFGLHNSLLLSSPAFRFNCVVICFMRLLSVLFVLFRFRVSILPENSLFTQVKSSTIPHSL